MGSPIGLDFGPVMTVAAARGADLELLADVLPEVENALLDAISGEPEDEETDH